MKSLPHRHLTTLSLNVDLAAIVAIGDTPAGHRLVAPVSGGTFAGERLSGTVLPGGSDWVTRRTDGNSTIDVRLTLQSDDGATLGLTYQGRFLGAAATLQRFVAGLPVDAADFSLQTVAKFETGDARYAWLNDAIVIGVGEQTDSGPAYQLYEIDR
ncbi:DUF3237 domain-containing protein [Sphingomonas sp.]|uniref:DUF3237 domain-containing protein n=1 Tax=Sphingomonas sp. TaxID=28214 RepID=UPI00286AFD05|nr:DUF3237 domain-containing protein [Sphingomonas sp.]